MQIDNTIANQLSDTDRSMIVRSIIMRGSQFFNAVLPHLSCKDRARLAQCAHEVYVAHIKPNQNEDRIKMHNEAVYKRIMRFNTREGVTTQYFKKWLSSYVLMNPKHIYAQTLTEFVYRSPGNGDEFLIKNLLKLAKETQSIESMEFEIDGVTIGLLNTIAEFKKLKRLSLRTLQTATDSSFNMPSQICFLGMGKEHIALIGEKMPDLEVLDMENPFNGKWNDGEILSKLPQGLKSLHIIQGGMWKLKLEKLKLPQYITDLTLRGYVLDNNAIDELTNLKQLTQLDLSKCDIQDFSNFKLISKCLEILNLANCGLTDNVIMELSQNENVSELTIGQNPELNGSHFEHLPKKLKILRCNDCNILDQICEKLKDHECLEEINLRGNRLTGGGLTYLPKQVKKLSVSELEKLSEWNILELQTLKTLSITDTDQLTHEWLCSLPLSLESLVLSDTNIDDEMGSSLERLVHLKELHVNCTEINGAVFTKLSRTVEALNLSGCQIDEKELKDLVHFPKLTHLCLQGNNFITDKGIEALPVTVVGLDISSCKKLTDGLFKTLSRFSDLTDLYVNNNSSITGSCIGYIPKNVKKIQIYDCELTEKAKQELLEIPSIRDLKIYRND